ncbi:hypothetical protein [Acidomonas methanolica]|uniref:Uncharacterized protein n=1 Tax=Acidomonas methanolica NBRC 104435 TaxID=1231351 RepID=A0A023D5A5_ACIMT|nr:hypothetical protein [Acidomonas methanolica]MBU2655091.1 hypothetical protein [Acidomonas methanolica]TCS29501.1 hypothetical protein EDC31_10672 [Acidomonas methanolica]GAJ29343.1 hypothetical protein Amme_059_062 [Acidomonas methanolica NBRC 104435]GBQ45493.1 hypothetical protein AA0498_0062 [Acidomonas methanolica]GEK99107.1 hypothetical protein AME01nite_16060 [Acidomonas methanolica NBRC 104435]
MSPIPSIAVALEGGIVLAVVLQDWPSHIPHPRIVVVDYDIDGADQAEIKVIPTGDGFTEALCYSEQAVIYENAPGAISPDAIINTLTLSADRTD